MTNFSDRMVEMGGDDPIKALPVLQEALMEASGDLGKLVNKWQDDMPILLAAVMNTVPQMEQICGKAGVEASRALQQITACIVMIRDK